MDIGELVKKEKNINQLKKLEQDLIRLETSITESEGMRININTIEDILDLKKRSKNLRKRLRTQIEEEVTEVTEELMRII